MKALFYVAIVVVVFSCLVGGTVILANANQDLPRSNKPLSPSGIYQPEAPIDQHLIQADNEFAFKLFSELRKKDGSKNVFISGPSVALMLSMAYNGAVGDTQRDMAKALQIDGMNLDILNGANSALLARLNRTDLGVELSVANSLWGNKDVTFSQPFLGRNSKYYQAKIEALDFGAPSAVDTINGWVATQTKGKIKKIITQLDPSSVLVLANTVYFNGKWQSPFERAQTKQQDFFLKSGEHVSVPMMSKEISTKYQENTDFKAIELPYDGRQMSMYVFLPSKSTGIEGFLRNLTPENWQTWMRSFAQADGTFKMPRFRSEYFATLRDQLRSMGMGIAFDSKRADFSQMSAQPVWIGQVLHKTFVDVNEEGSEVAAATAGVMVGSAMPMPKTRFEMTVDRPFFCAIRDNRTGLVLFMGVISHPAKS